MNKLVVTSLMISTAAIFLLSPAHAETAYTPEQLQLTSITGMAHTL